MSDAPARATAGALPHTLSRAAAIALALIALGAVLLMAYRAGLWLQYRPEGAVPWAELGRASWMGLRFDLKAMATLALPLLLLAALLPARARRPAVMAYTTLALLVLNLLAVVNHYYFGFFGSTIDPMIFGVVEDDTAIVVHTLVKDFPIVRVLLLWLGVSLGLAWLVLALGAWLERRLPRRAGLAWGLAFLLAAVLARGTLGSFPLGSKHLSVSADGFINQLVPNAFQSTYITVRNRLESSISNDTLSGIKLYGFKSPQQAARVLGLPDAADEDALLAQLYARVPDNPALGLQRPHVVFAMMESMGRHLLEYDGAGNDLLGRFRRHLHEDFRFTNFVSGQQSTHRTFESLLMNSPVSPLTQGEHGYRTFSAAAALPYQRAGYRTVFLTSGPASWRNIADILRHQGFDEVLDVSHVRARYPDAPYNIRGAPDAVTFRYARELLEQGEREGRPVFVFVFTTNNHPPHLLPTNYVLQSLDLSVFGPRQPDDRDKAMRILGTYQYASDALGEFLDELKASPLADRTVVAATGDHAVRDFFIYTGLGELALSYGVPAYFYLPPAQRKGLRYDPQRFGSHRDVFPTLYRHSLPRSCYLAVGNDLLGEAVPGAPFAPEPGTGMAVYDYVLGPEGAIARLGEDPQYLRWTDASRQRLEVILDAPPEALRKRALRERAYVALLDWQTRMQALQDKPAGPPCGP